MANGINKVFLIGNLGKDPEIKYLKSGDMVACFSLATSESWIDRNTNEKKVSVEWHSIIAYKRMAEICSKFLKQGSKVFVEGRIKTNKWKDKETGKDRSKIDIICETLQMLDSREEKKSKGNYGESALPYKKDNEEYVAVDLDSFDDDIPF